MRFKGDIIITDPCYIIDNDKGKGEEPDYAAIMRRTDHKASPDKWRKLHDKYQQLRNEWSRKYDDWSRCGYGQNMEVLGIKTYLTSDTEYGDWSCTTVRDDDDSRKIIAEMNQHYLEFFNKYNFSGLNDKAKKKLLKTYQEERKKYDQNKLILGHFCADAGLVSVFLLDEVLAYNPNFDYHLNRLHTTTLIRDFDGDIEITHRDVPKQPDEDEDDEYNSGREVSVVGRGNVNFYTTQTGF